MQTRGFAVDSAKTDSAFTRVVMANPAEKFRLMLAQKDGKLIALQENYKISTNDSTRQLWQQMRDDFEKDLGAWPNMPKHGDDHKVAKFEADGGFITLTLENTYKPTLTVRYDRK
jgi:Spy/CpxP family protein refolding chaperone